MNFRYLPMTDQDEKEMLRTIGVTSTEDLFSDIPEEIRLTRELNLKPPYNETKLMTELTHLANTNATTKTHTSFLGAGVYDHYIPSVVDHVISRSEFYTAYTPYQPEISQGELQAIFEFQTMICQLTAMDIANSSMYDGATALAEAMTISTAQTKRKKVLVSKTIHPESLEVMYTYAKGHNIEITEIPEKNGITDLDQVASLLDDSVASVIVQYPNFFGQIEPLAKVNEMINDSKTMLIVSSNPLSLGMLTPPGDLGADFVVGDTQVFGIPAQYGGPHCGYFATKKKWMRKVPGRLVGQTVDEDGKRGFVLTLQAREQHIRREKATSNICSNQALNALASSVAMSALGRKGLKEMAYQNMQKAQFAKRSFQNENIPVRFEEPMFNEFVIQLNQPVTNINKQLLKKGIIGGFDLGVIDKTYENCMLVAVTEMRTKKEIEDFVKGVGEANDNR
ncbi:putative glycine dehydrogenase (decarboxylating) subunit 1 [Paraliobacillus sp. PM-2]|uniref:aminomethyl-transferring glycine dehydrogenase subunit GcvPA n=1 Tax=Paraliobacillus sp. PM-2 TaxID=1462524 RepID=UPI00061C404C|nr:aminomethyl-transferring glycine dehydrogenase subunit GcvPA [Paraliobacillus sp. PM-2]CQR46827.1 putative glycine dehydrogenase (decarboxylating) subunit 1 [Paraliobacillus sp. PM-2]